jgi:hypothetical protein
MSGEFYYPEIIGSGVALFVQQRRQDRCACAAGTLLVPGKSTVSEAECSARLYRSRPRGRQRWRATPQLPMSPGMGLCTHGYEWRRRGRLRQRRFSRVILINLARPINYSGTMAMERRRRPTAKTGVAGDSYWGNGAPSSITIAMDSSSLRCQLRRFPARKEFKCMPATRARLLRAVGLQVGPGILYHNHGNGTFEDVSSNPESQPHSAPDLGSCCRSQR